MTIRMNLPISLGFKKPEFRFLCWNFPYDRQVSISRKNVQISLFILITSQLNTHFHIYMAFVILSKNSHDRMVVWLRISANLLVSDLRYMTMIAVNDDALKLFKKKLFFQTHL